MKKYNYKAGLTPEGLPPKNQKTGRNRKTARNKTADKNRQNQLMDEQVKKKFKRNFLRNIANTL